MNYLRIATDPMKGRCFYASKPIMMGDTVFVATPFAKVVDQQSLSKICTCCVQEPDSSDPVLFYHCSNKCGRMYCSSDCVDRDWLECHNLECSFEAPNGLSSYAQDYFALLIRVLIKRHQNTQHPAITEIDTMHYTVESQSNDQVSEYLQVSQELDRFLQERIPDFVFPPVPNGLADALKVRISKSITMRVLYLYSLISREECNSFGLYTYKYQGSQEPRQSFGLALFPTAVYFNHSCDPNIGRAYINGNMEFFAIKDIKNGEEAMITYIDLDGDFQKRQSELMGYFHFKCTCSRCSNPNPNPVSKISICGKHGCKAFLKPSELGRWQCHGCQNELIHI